MSNRYGVPGVATETKARIAIVDDDESVREAITGLLRSLGLSVEAFPSAVELLSYPAIKDISCLIADIHMPRMTGVELHRRLRELGYTVPTILITAFPDDAVRARALADGVICYLGKPFDDNALIACVNSVLDQTLHDEDRP
jgi:FixJ family two-component response regulator